MRLLQRTMTPPKSNTFQLSGWKKWVIVCLVAFSVFAGLAIIGVAMLDNAISKRNITNTALHVAAERVVLYAVPHIRAGDVVEIDVAKLPSIPGKMNRNTDGWNTPIRVSVYQNVVRAYSAGPDKRWQTPDDIEMSVVSTGKE